MQKYQAIIPYGLLTATMGLSCLLAGCTLGPNYHRPPLDIPKAYHYEVADAQETVNSAWWEQFQDPVLESLIREALANNKDVMIAAANIENAIGILVQTRAALFPQIGYNGVANRTLLSASTAIPLNPLLPNPQNNFQALFGYNWQIDLWGRIMRQTQAAQANMFATIEARRNVILSLVASVANSYIQLLGLDEQLAISKRTQKSYQDSLKYFELQFQHGQVSEMTVAQALTQYEQAASVIPQAELQIILTENALSVLLGRNPGPIQRGKPLGEFALPAVPAGIPSEILENRPDILEAEQNLIAANAQIGAAKALYFPSITLTGDYGGASAALRNLFKGPAKTWSYTGEIAGPILTWGAISGQVTQAEAQAEALLVSYEQTVQDAFADVEDSLASHMMLKQQLEAQGRLVAASGNYVYLATLQYNGGYSPYFAVLQAQQQLFPAELSMAQTQAQLYSSLVNIYQSMGGGWVITAERLTAP